MNDNKKIIESDDQFVISYELLHILQWILQYETDALLDLTERAFHKGVAKKKGTQDLYNELQTNEDVQNSIVDFFALLETHVADLNANQSTKHIMQTNLLKAIDHIDPKLLDPSVIHNSMLTTAEKLPPQHSAHAKELFLQEVLRNWKPQKKTKNESEEN